VDLLLRLFALAATGLFLLATAVMLLTFRRARRVTSASLLVPAVLSLAILALYCVLLGAAPSAAMFLASLVLGAALGSIWARTHQLFRGRDGAVRSQANIWYLAVWAGVLVLNQLIVLAAGRGSRVLVGLLVFATGIAAGNTLVLLRRLRRLRAAAALAIGLLAAGGVAGADDVLLLLPRNFDVRPIGGWGERASVRERLTAEQLARDKTPFQFRGEDVTHVHESVDHYGGECTADIQYRQEFKARFRRGSLEGRWVATQRNYNRGDCPGGHGEVLRIKYTATITGRANADGRLEMVVRVTEGDFQVKEADGWVTRNDGFRPWSFGLEFQLPVGELQSSQKLSPKPVPEPRAGRGAEPGRTARSESHREGLSGGGARPDGEETLSSGDGADSGDADARDESDKDSQEPPPVSPAEAAGAAAGAAGLALLGTGWMLLASGVRPGDLLAPPPADAPEPPAPPPAPRDGDVNPETGEVWSAEDGAWMGPEYARIRQARQSELVRAQQVSAEESSRDAADVDRELRASEERLRMHAGTQADAAREFEIEASFRPQRIEPYQPAWSDRVTDVLEIGEEAADKSVSLLGALTGEPGKVIGQVYTVTKETVKGTSEGVAAYARGRGGHLASDGSAWVIAERAAIGFAKGGAKLKLDEAAGKVMDGVAKLAGGKIPELPDLGDTSVVSVVRETVGGAGERAARRAVGIAAGKGWASDKIQKPAGWAVPAATGEKL
jgi:hypothetical protein